MKIKTLDEIKAQAECLKLEIWLYLDKEKIKGTKSKEAMNSLLDELDFLEEQQ